MIPVRIFLDAGSSGDFITQKCVDKLKLKTQVQDTAIRVTGLGGESIGTSRLTTSLRLHSRIRKYSRSIEAFVLKTVTAKMPHNSFNPADYEWDHLEGIESELADPEYFRTNDIDILLGVDHVGAILRAARRFSNKGPVATASAFGWVISGKILNTKWRTIDSHHCSINSLDHQIQKYFAIEEVPQEKPAWTEEEETAEGIYAKCVSRRADGRYVVPLLINPKTYKIDNNVEEAYGRFLSLERKFEKNPEFKRKYSAVIQEYFDLSQLEEVSGTCLENWNLDNSFYIAHHAVYKADSTTTKMRVVFDASAGGDIFSLNEGLLTGPKIQRDIFDQLIRFRGYEIAITSDITKMYRQFLIRPEETDYQRIFWRDSPTEKLKAYRLLTVTFGVRSAPFCAIRTCHQIADDHKERYPAAAQALKNWLYVDDLLAGAQTEKEAVQLYQELTELASHTGLEFRKWSSNSESVLGHIPKDHQEFKDVLEISKDEVMKTLGLMRSPVTDEFSFKINLPESKKKMTKRILLSNISRLYDPLGFLSPVSIKLKVNFQLTWKQNLGWDQELPQELIDEWTRYADQAKLLEQIRIPRCVVSLKAKRCELHVFGDASERAYAAVVYLRRINEDKTVRVFLIASKTKVAQPISIPRLELCASYIGSKLIRAVENCLEIKIDAKFGWTDSTVTLAWIQGDPGRWSVFVQNRVQKIQSILPASQWFHVPGVDNPADCASRGLDPSELVKFKLWFSGPDFLQSPELHITQQRYEEDADVQKELKRKMIKVVHHIQTVPEKESRTNLLERFSDLTKCLRVVAWIRRFIHNSKSKTEGRHMSKFLTIEEIEDTRMCVVKITQQEEFHKEINLLSQRKPITRESKIQPLAPFVDPRGFLRVGGRLQKAALSENAKHHLLLPPRHHLSKLIVKHEHEANLHANPRLLMSLIHNQYWILRGKDLIRKTISHCRRCQTYSPVSVEQFMGDLPEGRVTFTPPFSHCGLDYAGHFMILNKRGRGARLEKAWVSVFVCFVTKAVHLELVRDGTTEAFLNALRRFVSRRGCPVVIYSDNGPNFVGAENELRRWYESFTSGDVNKSTSEIGITWKFIPPGSPHMGGLWEAAVKKMKYHLKRVVGENHLTEELMSTLLCQIESTLNKRPLTEESADPNDLRALTPGYFLMVGGRPTELEGEPDLQHLKMNRCNYWQQVQHLFQQWKERWENEYLPELQKRGKWTTTQKDIKEGQLVLVKEDNQPSSRWKMARVTKLHPGSDNKVRVVTVKIPTCKAQNVKNKDVKTDILEKNITIAKICPLETDSIWSEGEEDKKEKQN